MRPETSNVADLHPASEVFYSGALVRIARMMIALSVIAAAGIWLRFGWRIAAGFAAGAAIAYINFHWLKRAVIGLADRITQTPNTQRRSRVVLRFFIRYVLACLAAYWLYRFAPETLIAFLAGLFLPVAAILCEAAFEVYTALARGT